MGFRAEYLALRRTILVLSCFLIGSGSSFATSSAPRSASSSALTPREACQVRSRFIEAAEKNGKVVWKFKTLSPPVGAMCSKLSDEFEVWIWSGRYSNLSKSFVYPLSINAPEEGSEQTLRVEWTSIRDASDGGKETQGWFPSIPFLPEGKVRP
jgi:hypothetical protein